MVGEGGRRHREAAQRWQLLCSVNVVDHHAVEHGGDVAAIARSGDAATPQLGDVAW